MRSFKRSSTKLWHCLIHNFTFKIFFKSSPGCPRNHDGWFFNFKCLLPWFVLWCQREISHGRHIVVKLTNKIKYIWVKVLFNKINCKKSLISYTIYGRRHLKLFTNFHVSWDTLYELDINFNYFWNLFISFVVSLQKWHYYKTYLNYHK